MPTYEYLCHNTHCGHEFEIFQSMKDNALETCPQCEHTTLRRKIGLGAGIIFKGSGFYETDYKRKPAAEGSETTPKSDSGSSSKNETKEPAKPVTSASPTP